MRAERRPEMLAVIQLETLLQAACTEADRVEAWRAAEPQTALAAGPRE